MPKRAKSGLEIGTALSGKRGSRSVLKPRCWATLDKSPNLSGPPFPPLEKRGLSRCPLRPKEGKSSTDASSEGRNSAAGGLGSGCADSTSAAPSFEPDSGRAGGGGGVRRALDRLRIPSGQPRSPPPGPCSPPEAGGLGRGPQRTAAASLAAPPRAAASRKRPPRQAQGGGGLLSRGPPAAPAPALAFAFALALALSLGPPRRRAQPRVPPGSGVRRKRCSPKRLRKSMGGGGGAWPHGKRSPNGRERPASARGAGKCSSESVAHISANLA